MKTRLITAAVGVPFLIFTLVVRGWFAEFVIVALTFIAMYETYRALKKAGVPELVRAADGCLQYDIFSTPEEQERRAAAERESLAREKSRQEAIVAIRRRYGKNAILKGTNFREGATTRERNAQIGGHKA